MSRQARISFPGAWYHIINRGVLRSNIFYSAGHKKHFSKLMGEMVEKYKVEIHAYCLMDNHFHLIVHTPEANISEAIHFLESAYVNRINAEFEREGPFFKGRFLGIVVDSDAYLTHLARYIHLNPKKAHMVARPEYYTWSSYQSYLGLRTAPEWLTTETLLAHFNNDPNELQVYTDDTETLDIANFYSQNEVPLIMGDEQFRQNIKQRIMLHDPASESLALPIFRDRYSIEQITDVINFVLTTSTRYFQILQSRYPSIKRNMLTYIAKEKSGQPISEIATQLEFRSVSSVCNAVSRFNKNMQKDADLKHLLEICLTELQKQKPINTDHIIAAIEK